MKPERRTLDVVLLWPNADICARFPRTKKPRQPAQANGAQAHARGHDRFSVHSLTARTVNVREAGQRFVARRQRHAQAAADAIAGLARPVTGRGSMQPLGFGAQHFPVKQDPFLLELTACTNGRLLGIRFPASTGAFKCRRDTTWVSHYFGAPHQTWRRPAQTRHERDCCSFSRSRTQDTWD